MGYINAAQLEGIIQEIPASQYRDYLQRILLEARQIS